MNHFKCNRRSANTLLARRSHSDDMAAATVPPATPATFTVSANTQSGDNAPNPNNKTAVQIHREHVERLKELMRQQAAEQHAHTSE